MLNTMVLRNYLVLSLGKMKHGTVVQRYLSIVCFDC